MCMCRDINIYFFLDATATIFSAGLDHTLLGWEYSLEQGTDRLMYECKGHKGPIESIAVDSQNKFVSFFFFDRKKVLLHGHTD